MRPDPRQLSLDFDAPPRRLTFAYVLPSPRWIRVRYQLEDRLGQDVWARDDVTDASAIIQIRHQALT